MKKFMLIFFALLATLCMSFGYPRASINLHFTMRKTCCNTILRAESIFEPPKLNSKVIKLKDDIIALADKTRRGFTSSRAERREVNQRVNELATFSLSDEPAASYYEDTPIDSISTITGKWTLVYTDAPDITSLEGGPLSKQIGYVLIV